MEKSIIEELFLVFYKEFIPESVPMPDDAINALRVSFNAGVSTVLKVLESEKK